MTVLVTRAGAATGSRAAAAALACARSDARGAALLLDLSAGRAARPTPIATAAARDLEERLAAHLPDLAVASRGQICQLCLPSGQAGIKLVPAVLPLVRDSLTVLHAPPCLVQPLLDEDRICVDAALLRADLDVDRALTALAACDLIERGLRVAVLKRPLAWLTARAALLGALPSDYAALPPRAVRSLLEETR